VAYLQYRGAGFDLVEKKIRKKLKKNRDAFQTAKKFLPNPVAWHILRVPALSGESSQMELYTDVKSALDKFTASREATQLTQMTDKKGHAIQ